VKNNTTELKQYLQKALKHTEDFSLQEVKVLLSRAIAVVENVENKRINREKHRVQRQESTLVNKVANPWAVLQNIEEELALEKKKLTEIANKKKMNNIPQSNDEEELQNVFG
jgi:hypothetical protein